jgi:hypothetical protein
MTEITHVRQGPGHHLTAPGYITMVEREREALMYWLPLRGSPAAQSRQSAKLFLQSSELELPHPLSRRRGCPPPFGPGGGEVTLACGRGVGGSPNIDEGTYTVVL